MTAKQQNPLGTWRERQKTEIRSAIIKSALSLFEEAGFEKTTIRRIADRAGVGVGTIFNHYPDKSSLLVAALMDELEWVQAEAFKKMPHKKKLKDKLLHLSRTFYTYYTKKPDLSKTLLKETLFTTGKWKKKLNDQAFEYISTVSLLFEAARDKGDIRPDADCDLAAVSFFSHYLNTLYIGFEETRFMLDESLDLLGILIDQLITGIGYGEGKIP